MQTSKELYARANKAFIIYKQLEREACEARQREEAELDSKIAGERQRFEDARAAGAIGDIKLCRAGRALPLSEEAKREQNRKRVAAWRAARRLSKSSDLDGLV